MKILFKWLFVLTLAFATSISFATENEEHQELMSIVKPIVSQINPLNSSTKPISLELIKRQEVDRKQMSFSEDEVDKVIKDLGRSNTISPVLYQKLLYAEGIFDKCEKGDVNDMTTKQFALSLIFAWKKQVANCNTYANLALTVFEFNRMNSEKIEEDKKNRVNSEEFKESKKVFKEAVLVGALSGTGDHKVLLVEDMNETVFVVDPWSQHVWKMHHFPSFANIRNWSNEYYRKTYKKDVSGYDTDKLYPLLQKTSDGIIKSIFRLNPLYPLCTLCKLDPRDPLYRDKKYYDGYYVKDDTQWVMQVGKTERIRHFVHTRNQEMRDFYTELRPIFPGWVKEYDELLPDRKAAGDSGSGTGSGSSQENAGITSGT